MFNGTTELVAALRRWMAILWTMTYYRSALRSVGARTWIRSPILITGGRWITIGERTSIRNGARIEVIRRNGEPAPSLVIGNYVSIEQGVHIVCSSRIVIEDNVAIAARCAIVDTTHPLPAGSAGNVGQYLEPGDHWVHIGSGSMLGVGVVILPNVTIGPNCMIGANSVVTRDIPANSVAAGAPARVLRRST